MTRPPTAPADIRCTGRPRGERLPGMEFFRYIEIHRWQFGGRPS
ncbi:hypothetical protein [Streptomyces sp. DASNCL29]|nr:hypothetical protein [Streptomyces sp. DASNCL29]